MPKSERTAALSQLLRQSFDIFNTYGKQPESLKSMVHGFDVVLQKYSTEVITAAFSTWLEEQSCMPTPADIKYICANRIKLYEPPPPPPPDIEYQPSEEEVAAVKKIVMQARDALAMPSPHMPEPKKAEKLSNEHWERTPEDKRPKLGRHISHGNPKEADGGFHEKKRQALGLTKDEYYNA